VVEKFNTGRLQRLASATPDVSRHAGNAALHPFDRQQGHTNPLGERGLRPADQGARRPPLPIYHDFSSCYFLYHNRSYLL
jgi:hypothetical protein